MAQHKAFVILLAGVVLLLSGVGCQSAKPTKQAPKQYSFWPPAPDEPRIQFLVAFNSSADVSPPQSRMDEVLYGPEQVLPITKPYGVGMWQGKIYVCDVRGAGLTVLDLRQHLAKAVGVGGTMEIGRATDIAIAPDGLKYVVDGAKHTIIVLDAADKAVGRFAPQGVNPVSDAVYGEELYVADFTGQTIRVLNRRTGEVLRSIGQAGPDDGQFVRPLAVRVSPQGDVFVVDVLKSRVQRFSRDGKFLSAFGQPGNNAGDLVRPKHFAFDKAGDLYIVDAGFSNVQVFDEHQKIAGYFGSPGAHPGAMDLPVGICVSDDPSDVALFKEFIHPAFQAERLIVVTNQFGPTRVAVYAGGSLKLGKKVSDIAGARSDISTGTLAPTTGPATQPDIFQGAQPTGMGQ